jgi:hypothetical protein
MRPLWIRTITGEELRAYTYRSEFSKYSVTVHPSSTCGKGPGWYTWQHAEATPKTQQLPMTCWDGIVSDDGRLIGFAYPNGMHFSPLVVLQASDDRLQVLDTIDRADDPACGGLHLPPFPIATLLAFCDFQDLLVVSLWLRGRLTEWLVYTRSQRTRTISFGTQGEGPLQGFPDAYCDGIAIGEYARILGFWIRPISSQSNACRVVEFDAEGRLISVVDLGEEPSEPRSRMSSETPRFPRFRGVTNVEVRVNHTWRPLVKHPAVTPPRPDPPAT